MIEPTDAQVQFRECYQERIERTCDLIDEQLILGFNRLPISIKLDVGVTEFEVNDLADTYREAGWKVKVLPQADSSYTVKIGLKGTAKPTPRNTVIASECPTCGAMNKDEISGFVGTYTLDVKCCYCDTEYISTNK